VGFRLLRFEADEGAVVSFSKLFGDLRLPQTSYLSLKIIKTHGFSLTAGTVFLTDN
jgi:hypothetical protein